MTKTYRRRETKPDTLEVYYGKDDGGSVGVVYATGVGADRADLRYVSNVMGEKRYLPAIGNRSPSIEPAMIDELIERGYDITTLKFSIKKKK